MYAVSIPIRSQRAQCMSCTLDHWRTSIQWRRKSARAPKADVSNLRSDVSSLSARSWVLPARLVRERDVQRVEMRRLSAGASCCFPCFLAKSPCISQFSRERRVGIRLPAQPLSTHSLRGKGLSSGCAQFIAEFRLASPARSWVTDGRDGFAAKSGVICAESLSGGI
jgi:hypothetical protein